ncbi:hypothetical protein [Virgibacillus sp. DJP39]|uniref:hypothetical protein n=1 Tax=Virgibacillus sp. DJP39 TaxID=3409790 RepID=UPI003BB67984
MSNRIKQEVNKVEIPKELSERSKLGVIKAKLEIKKSKKKWTYLTAPVVAAALAFVFLSPSNMHEIIPGQPKVETVGQSNVIDTSNPRKLVGFSDNVFVGKVIEQIGTKSLNGFPETQFKVEVLDNIKGDLKGTVTVNQQGGHEWNKIIIFEGDKLLEAGNTYLFATRYLEREDWYTLVPVHGDILITSKQEKTQLIEKYTNAYENEMPFDSEPGTGSDTGK